MGKTHILIGCDFSRNQRAEQKLEKERVIRCVNLCLFIRNKLGIKDTCLSGSLLLYNMLRQTGFDVKINFGIDKKSVLRYGDIPFIGHCWVTLGDENMAIPQIPIFTYPP